MRNEFKKYSVQLAVLILTAVIMQSCGSKSEYNIKPQATPVKGILGDYLQVKDGQFKLQKVKDDGSAWSVSIPLKRIKKPLNACNHYNFSLDLTLFDSKGQPITLDGGNFRANTSQVVGPKICGLLQDDNTTEDFIVFTRGDESSTNTITLPNDIASFTIGSEATYQGGGPAKTLEQDVSDKSESASTSESNKEVGNQDWDKLLKDYEVYTDKYIELMKKAKKNDVSAMGDYQDMLDKAEKLGKDLDKAQSKLSSDQLNKMMQIQTKLANAAMEMAK